MLEIRCDICKRILNKQGGLIFGPPDNGMSEKFHICIQCFEALKHKIKSI